MRNTLIFLIFISSFLLFYRLGDTSLVNWDEAWIASVAQDIANRNDWLGGQWNGQTWFYEPPLVTGTLAILYKIFGPSEFWLRSFNAFLGLLIVILVYKLSATVTKSAASAFISTVILLSDIEFLFRSRQINVEIPVTFFLLLTIFCLLKTDRKRANFANEIAIGASLGLAFLTKRASPILILPAICFTLLKTPPSLPARQSLALQAPAGGRARRGGRSNLTPIFIFVITFISIILPWFVASYLKWGNQFVNEFFLGYTLGKIRSINPGTGTVVWFYVTSLRHAFKFFFPLIPFAIIWATIKSFHNRKIAVLTIYILTFLIFLTLAPIKSSWFLLPVHPAIALVTGLFLEKFAKLLKRMKSFANFLIPSLIIIISAWQLWHYKSNYIVPDTTGHQAALAKLAGQLSKPQQPIYLDDDYLPVAVFYSRRRVIPLRFNRLQPITPLPIPPGSHILTNTETLPSLQNTYPNITFIKESGDLILVQNQTIPSF